ncbi:MAG: hypothetical protein M3014_12060 [Chloroflexota bacterium]|nr:hypothetical protein [Chloroflexota bacterium]
MTAQAEVVEATHAGRGTQHGMTGLTAQRLDIPWIIAATALITLAVTLFGLWGSNGHLAPPLDDTFIHFQYARQIAAGHPFQYNTGDAPSSGDSAFIYPFLLAPAYLLGLDGLKVLIYADLLNFAAHIALVVLLYKLALQLAGRTVALLSVTFVLLDGSLNWTFSTGMETGIYAAALVAFFYLCARDLQRRRFGPLVALGALTALIRPEAHIIVSLACLLIVAYLWRSDRFSAGYLLLLLPVVIGLLPYGLNIAMTGNWQYNTAASKSVLYLPYTPLHEKLSLIVGYAVTAVKNIYFGTDIGRSPFPLFAATLAVAGVGIAVAPTTPTTPSTRHFRFLNLLMALTLILGIMLAFLLPPIHFYRYNQPYDAFFYFFFAVGLAALARLAARAASPGGVASEGPAFAGRYSVLVAGSVVAVLLLPQFVTYFFAFSDSTRDIYYQQMAFSEWVKENTPADARIGVNDTGAHKYMADRYIIDLIGLTYNPLRGAYFSGWGTIYDTLAGLPEKERPTYLLIHPDVFITGIPDSVGQKLLTPIYSITVQNPIITAGPTEVLYKINWEYALQEPRQTYLLHQGLQTSYDTLNVGDLEDERRHAYSTTARQSQLPEPKSIVTTSSYGKKQFALSESGRRHTGREEFTVNSVPGKALTVVARCRLDNDADQTTMVWANGKQVGLWKEHNDRGGSWQEYEYTIPAEFITGSRTRISIDATFDPGGPGFTSYRYWFYGP